VTSSLGIRRSALAAWHGLHHRLAELTEPTPCQAEPHAWTEPVDADTAEMARHLCNTCPAIAACDAFATTNRECSGIWAGRSREPKRGRPAAQPEGATA